MCKRETSIMLVSKVTVAVGALVFCSLSRHAWLFVPTNLATNLNVRKRSDAATADTETVSKKEGIYTFISARVRSDPLRLLGSNVTRDRREDSETTLVFARTPSFGFWLSFCDRAFGLLASPTFPERPRVAGIRSRVGSLL